MSRIFFTLLALWWAAQALAQPAANRPDRVVLQNYSLKQCIEYATAHATSVLNAQADVASAKAQVGVVRADGLPQINGNAAITGNVRPLVTLFPAAFANIGGGSNPNQDPNEFVPFRLQPAYSGQYTVNFSQLLFDGSFFLGLKAATVYQELSQKALERSKIDVAAAVSKAYYAVAVSEERMALIDANYQRLSELHREIKALNQNGFAEKIDVDRVEVNLNNLKVEKQKAERLVDLGKALLKFQMGLLPDDELSIGEKIKDMKLEAAIAATEADPANRIEYSLLETQRQLDLMNIKNTRLGYLPKLNLIANYSGIAGRQQGQFLEMFNFGRNWFSYSAIGVSLQVPIFDGLRKKHLNERNRLALVKTENQMQELRRVIGLETSQANTSLQNALDNLTVQKRNMELATEIIRVSKIKYKEGLGSSTEVLAAENDYKAAETNYYNALYEALVAKVDLDKAQGKLME